MAIATGLLAALIWLLSSAGGNQLAPGLSNTMPLGAALLIAACLGSTDAGATINVLSSVRHLVPGRLRHLLEFESSVNDPTALLMFGLIAGLFSTSSAGASLEQAASVAVILNGLRNFIQQVGGGLIVGALFGYVARFVINELAYDKSQLLIVAISLALVDYGCSHFLGGSGFISVYTTGAIMSNMIYRQTDINHESIQEVLLPFNAMAEICIFLMFGLLINPSSLLPALPVGLITAAMLMLVVRPISVLVWPAGGSAFGPLLQRGRSDRLPTRCRPRLRRCPRSKRPKHRVHCGADQPASPRPHPAVALPPAQPDISAT